MNCDHRSVKLKQHRRAVVTAVETEISAFVSRGERNMKETSFESKTKIKHTRGTSVGHETVGMQQLDERSMTADRTCIHPRKMVTHRRWEHGQKCDKVFNDSVKIVGMACQMVHHHLTDAAYGSAKKLPVKLPSTYKLKLLKEICTKKKTRPTRPPPPPSVNLSLNSTCSRVYRARRHGYRCPTSASTLRRCRRRAQRS